MKCLIVSSRYKVHIVIVVVCAIVGLELQPGAAGFQLSNPPVLEIVSLLASLNVRTYTYNSYINMQLHKCATYKGT